MSLLPLSTILFALTLQPDGKIIVAGSDDSILDFMVARFLPNGTVDPSFGGGSGFVTTDFGSEFYELVQAVIVTSTGKIVAVGETVVEPEKHVFAIARYNANGSLDTTFDGDGRVTTSFSAGRDAALAVAEQADGKILVGGLGADGFPVARYLANGALDPSFSGGRFSKAVNGGGAVTAIGIQTDGNILLTGGIGNGTFTVLRVRAADGVLDSNFGLGGVATAFAGGASGLVLQEDGRIVLAGSVPGPGSLLGQSDFGVVRFNHDGTVDPTFGAAGLAQVDFDGKTNYAVAVAIQPDGRIIVAGRALNLSPSGISIEWALARLDGTPLHALTFYLNGDDGVQASIVAGDRLMTENAPAPARLSVLLTDHPTWTTDVPLSGAIRPGTTLQLQVPCSRGLAEPKLIQVWALSEDQTTSQEIARLTHKGACSGWATLQIPFTVPLLFRLLNQSLRLGMTGRSATDVDLDLGLDTWLSISAFIGTP